MTLEQDILVSLLADTDAAFLPIRSWFGDRARAICEARNQFNQSGFAWRPPGVDADQRRLARGALNDLGERGLVDVQIDREGVHAKVTGVSLTDDGEAYARALCGLPDFECPLLTMREMAAIHGRGGAAEYLGNIWVHEAKLAGRGRELDRQELMLVEMMILPALIRGFVESNSTAQGHVCYRLAKPIEDWRIPKVDLPNRKADCRLYYNQRTKAGVARWGAADVNNVREIGEIPLPLSVVSTKAAG